MSANTSELMKLIPPLLNIAERAGEAILEVYNSSLALEIITKDDNSPVTKADHAAHEVIDTGLKLLTPDIPRLSEEGCVPDFSERAGWGRYWLIDPLDGTKEFINRNGEYTVNIALILNHEPVLGLVYVPVTKVFYYGVKGQGSWKKTEAGVRRISVRNVAEAKPFCVVASRRHGADALEGMIQEAKKAFGHIEKVSMGSSLKICMLAEGVADWYPRLALTSEWDTAAAQAVLEAAGGLIYDDKFEPLECNRKDSLLNPFFHAVADANFDWKRLVEKALKRR